MPKRKTPPSTPRLSDVAKHVRPPAGVVSTGWPAVEQKCHDLGIRFRWWQKPIGQLILAKRATGKYAATIGGTGMSIPRQVGKTFLVAAIVFALCLMRSKLTVVWTAHRVRTSEETFKKMQAFARRKRIAPYVAKVTLGSGEECIEFRNGSRILFGARATGFGRGFDEVDVLIFDEAQILTEASLDDMIPATNQSRQPTGALLLFMGTPPKPSDPGEVFTRMRSEALSGEDEDTGWIEFGADDDYGPTLPPAPLSDKDWAQVAKANPSYPDDTPREAILRMRKKLGADSFNREGLGRWDKDERTRGRIKVDRWADLKIEAIAPSRATVVVDVSPDLEWSSVALASDVGGRTLLLVEHFEGTDDAVDQVEVLRANLIETLEVALTPTAKVLSPELTAAKIDHVVLSGPESNAGCAWLITAVRSWSAVHVGQTVLEDQIRKAKTRFVSNAQVWDQTDRELDLTALVAASVAGQRWSLLTAKPNTPPPAPRRAQPAARGRTNDIAHAGF